MGTKNQFQVFVVTKILFSHKCLN